MDKKLIRRFLKNEKAPCDACDKKLHCKEEEVACRVFSYYVSTGYFPPDVERTPTKEVYTKIYDGDTPLNQIWNHIDEPNNN